MITADFIASLFYEIKDEFRRRNIPILTYYSGQVPIFFGSHKESDSEDESL